MKKATLMTGTAVCAAAAAAGWLLMRPKPTPEEVKNPIDVQYEKLCIRMYDLEAQVQQPDANIDSLFTLLLDLRWQQHHAGRYEQQKFNLWLDQKKNAAMTFRKVAQERGLPLDNPQLLDVETISE